MSIDAGQTLRLYMHANRLTRKLAERLELAADGRFTAGELEVMLLISADEGIRPTQLALALDRATPTIAHVVTRLEERGLITRERHATDGREQLHAADRA